MGQLTQFVTNHWALWLALVAILILIFFNEFIAQKKRAKELSPAAAIDLINHNNAVVIDLRDPDAFRDGHIVDSIRISAEEFNQQRTFKNLTDISSSYIIVCVNR